MHYDEFVKKLQSGKPNCCYSITGDDRYWTKNAYSALVSLVDSVDLTVLTAPQKIDEGLFALEIFPMLSEYKIAVLADYEKFSADDKTRLKKYLDNPVDGAVLVLYNSECVAHPNCEVYNFSHLSETALVPIIIEECKNAGAKITVEAARLLAVYAETDMAIIDMELKKLIAYAGIGEEIGSRMVRECVTPNITYQVYHFADAVARGSYKDAYGALDSLTNSTSEYSRFLSNVTSYYRMVLYAKISNMTDAELAKALSAKEYPVKKARTAAKKYGARPLFELLKLLYNLEFEFKSGRISVENALELAIAEAIERRIRE